jgi:hypothetical protein
VTAVAGDEPEDDDEPKDYLVSQFAGINASRQYRADLSIAKWEFKRLCDKYGREGAEQLWRQAMGHMGEEGLNVYLLEQYIYSGGMPPKGTAIGRKLRDLLGKRPRMRLTPQLEALIAEARKVERTLTGRTGRPRKTS